MTKIAVVGSTTLIVLGTIGLFWAHPAIQTTGRWLIISAPLILGLGTIASLLRYVRTGQYS